MIHTVLGRKARLWQFEFAVGVSNAKSNQGAGAYYYDTYYDDFNLQRGCQTNKNKTKQNKKQKKTKQNKTKQNKKSNQHTGAYH